MADDEAGLTVLNELTGAVVGGYDTPGQTWDVKLAGNFACLADGFGGVLVLDISDPTNPRYAGSYPTPGMAKEIYWDGENIYVADQYCLGIYRFTGTGVITAPGAGLPEQFALEAHPNPFNSELRLSLWLPGSVQALLEVFNLAGQRVARLNEAVLLPGQHEFFWRADDLASGIYLVRVQMGDFSLSRKVVLLK